MYGHIYEIHHGGENVIEILESIEPNVALAIAAAFGSLSFHVAGIIDAKNADRNMEYKYTYFVQTLVTVFMVAMLYQYTIIELSFFSILAAFMAGVGGNAGTSSLIRRKTPQ
jgi:hypothetical protein